MHLRRYVGVCRTSIVKHKSMYTLLHKPKLCQMWSKLPLNLGKPLLRCRRHAVVARKMFARFHDVLRGSKHRGKLQKFLVTQLPPSPHRLKVKSQKNCKSGKNKQKKCKSEKNQENIFKGGRSPPVAEGGPRAAYRTHLETFKTVDNQHFWSLSYISPLVRIPRTP